MAFASAASVANAITFGPSVWTTSTNNPSPKTNVFDTGQTIYIWWNTFPDSLHVTITVKNDQNQVVAGPFTDQQESSNTPIVLTNGLQPGHYKITMTYVLSNTCFSHDFTLAVNCFFVLPESIFGTISALGAGFAAFGLFGYVKLKKQKKP